MPYREGLRLLPGARQACLLLVHGGFHGAWCWEKLIVNLTERGVRVEAVDMPFTSFADDVAAVSTAIDRLAADGTPVVAVGHSMGGLHLTEAGAGGAGHRSATHLVYVTATMVDPESPPDDGTFNVTDALLHDGEQVRADPEVAPSIFYNRCDPEVAAWATSRLRAMSIASLFHHPARPSPGAPSRARTSSVPMTGSSAPMANGRWRRTPDRDWRSMRTTPHSSPKPDSWPICSSYSAGLASRSSRPPSGRARPTARQRAPLGRRRTGTGLAVAWSRERSSPGERPCQPRAVRMRCTPTT